MISYWLRKKAKRCAKKAPQKNPKGRSRRLKLVQKFANAKEESGRKIYPSCTAIRTALWTQHKLAVHRATVHRDLHALGLQARVRPKCCVLQKDYEKRRSFCEREAKRNKKVIFTDEKIFTTNDFGHRTEWVSPGERAAPRKRVRWPEARVQVWGAIGHNFRCLVIFPLLTQEEGEGNAAFRLTGDQYIRRCLSKIVPHVLATRSTLMQDGAGCHRKSKGYLESKGVSFIGDWPPRSPDLNPIETCWSVVQSNTSVQNPTSRLSLVRAVGKAWNDLPVSYVNKLCSGYKRRCQEVAALGGRMCK